MPNYAAVVWPSHDGGSYALEGDRLTFVVYLDQFIWEGHTVTVNYDTRDDSAAAGSDYARTTGSFTLGPGQSGQHVTVQTFYDYPDARLESTETMEFYITSVTATGPDATASIADSSEIGHINNHEPVLWQPTPQPPPASGTSIAGTSGKDNLKGTNADETFTAGRGDDRITTGGGLDIIVFREGDGKDYVSDFARGSDKVLLDVTVNGNHIDSFEELSSLSSVSVKKNEKEVTVAFDGGDALTLKGISDLSAGDWMFA